MGGRLFSRGRERSRFLVWMKSCSIDFSLKWEWLELTENVIYLRRICIAHYQWNVPSSVTTKMNVTGLYF